MKILGIETSCDETALCVLEAKGDFNDTSFNIMSNTLLSQIELHREFGGVYPHLAKREHSTNLTPMLEKVLKEADLYEKAFTTKMDGQESSQIEEMLHKEPELSKMLLPFLKSIEKPNIDKIAVTKGPGLEPALWVGINFAKALSTIWSIPIIPVNHMEGHIFSSLLKAEGDKNPETYSFKKPELPALALLVSGGHTELVLINEEWGYEIIGQTRDDAVGEAFDKVARMLDLPYPGGPEISKLAKQAREEELTPEKIQLPRPMLDSGDLDFSFSGIKTAVMYKLKKIEEIDDKTKKEVALDFENSVTQVLTKKTEEAINKYGTKTLLLGGGVSANTYLRESLRKMSEEKKRVPLHLPMPGLSIDNAIMVAASGYLQNKLGADKEISTVDELKATGGMSL